MIILKKFLNAIFLISFFLFFISFTAFSAPKLTIYTEESPPDQMLDKNGNLTGFAVEIVNEIQKRLKTNYPLEVVPWARGYKAAQTEPNVILFSTNRTAERDPQFHWVGPLAETSFGFYAKSDSKLVINNINDAKALGSIGVYLNDVRDSYLTKLGFKNLDRVSDNTLNYKKVVGGRLDVLAGSPIALADEAKSVGYSEKDFKLLYTFLKTQKYIVFSKATPKDVVQSWQDALDSMKKDGSFKTIFLKYFPNSPLPGAAETNLP